MKIHEGCTVQSKISNKIGFVRRINWSDVVEVKWQDGSVEMCPLDNLALYDKYKELYKNLIEQIPQFQTHTQLSDGRWVVSRPYEDDELKIKSRIKNAWLVLTGKAFVTKWY